MSTVADYRLCVDKKDIQVVVAIGWGLFAVALVLAGRNTAKVQKEADMLVGYWLDRFEPAPAD